MDLLKYKFMEVSMVMPMPLDIRLFREAQKRGFYNGHTPYNRLFSEIFSKWW